jgi:hypothetical protein
MKHYIGFVNTGQTFEERTGSPDEMTSAIGHIALSFSKLEGELSVSVAKLLKLNPTTAEIVTAEMSFKNKVHLFASLVREMSSSFQFNTGNAPTIEVLDELISCCFKAEELRNQIFHSSYTWDLAGSVKRRKATAKAAKGLSVQVKPVDSGYLLDVADFIGETATYIEEFFYLFEPKKTSSSSQTG